VGASGPVESVGPGLGGGVAFAGAGVPGRSVSGAVEKRAGTAEGVRGTVAPSLGHGVLGGGGLGGWHGKKEKLGVWHDVASCGLWDKMAQRGLEID